MVAFARRCLAALETHLAQGLCAALLLWSAWPWLPGVAGRPPRTIIFYGFSILGEVMTEGVFPAFQERWRREAGEEIAFISSFAGSGTITNQAILGVPAELVLVSMELDALRLEEAGRVLPGSWRPLPHQGVVNRTPCVILVREGNPHDIRDFEDLTRPGIDVVHPDPLTSGAANWAILAEWAAGEAKSPGGGRELLRGLWANVTARAASARAARTQFEQGFGDALVTYEQEVLRDRARGRLRGEIVVPRRTILCEHTLAVVATNVPAGDRELVDAFARFLWSDAAQDLFAEHGYRSVSPDVAGDGAGFEALEDPLTVSDLGGWRRAKAEIVDGIWRDAVMAELER